MSYESYDSLIPEADECVRALSTPTQDTVQLEARILVHVNVRSLALLRHDEELPAGVDGDGSDSTSARAADVRLLFGGEVKDLHHVTS